MHVEEQHAQEPHCLKQPWKKKAGEETDRGRLGGCDWRADKLLHVVQGIPAGYC